MEKMSQENVIDFNNLDPDVQELVRESISMMEYAYVPYSNFKVGAAIRCADDSISKGCNIENSSYPVSICAERAGIAKAISEGKQKFKAISVSANQINGNFTSPCGMCRQTLSEFGNMPVYLAEPSMKYVLKTSVQELLPLAFNMTADPSISILNKEI